MFNVTGKEVEAKERFQVSRENDRWRIRLKLNDWEEIAVVE